MTEEHSDKADKGATVEGEYRKADVDLQLPEVDKRPKRRLGPLIAFVAIVLILGSLGLGGYWLWQNTESVTARIDADRSQQAQLQAQIQALDTELGLLRGKQRAHEQSQEQNAKSIAQLQIQKSERDESQDNSLTALQNSLAEWAARSGTQQGGWQLAEAEWLLWLANMRLQLQQQFGGALSALTQADNLLQQMNHPRLRAVRAAIAEEMLAIKTAERPDIDNIALSLLAISNQAQSLPLPARPAPYGEEVEPVAAIENENPSGWKQVLNGLWEEVRSLVVIRRQEKNLRPWLSDNEEQLIYQGLQVRLDAARLAALRGKGGLYQQSVRSAQTWLLSWFDTNSETVSAVDAELNALARQKLDVPAPDISQSLTLLRELRQQGLF